MAKFKGLVKACECCGTEFKVPQSQAHVRTCSRECGYKIRKVANKKERLELRCEHCGDTFLERECHADRRRFCSTNCMHQSQAFAKEKGVARAGSLNPMWLGNGVPAISASGRPYRRSQPHIENEKSARRKRAKDTATPPWADLQRIREIYRLCQKINDFTGNPHHVDHIVPLVSDQVCGLHCEANLRILPQLENLKKHNRSWPDMP